MLKESNCLETTEYASPCVLLLGGFDGLHIGHKKLLDCAKSYGLPVGIMTILGGKGRELFMPDERREIFSRAGHILFTFLPVCGKLYNVRNQSRAVLLAEHCLRE